MNSSERIKPIRYNDPSTAHYITFSCNQRRNLFLDDFLFNEFIKSLDASRARHRFEIWAYVIMPNHVHLLLWLLESVTISQVLKGIKQPFSHRALKHMKLHYSNLYANLEIIRKNKVFYAFWLQGGGYDRNVYSDINIRNAIEYIHNNPVRKELVKSPEDWKWSSYRFWEYGDIEPIKMDIPVMWK
ncbi:MAG: transposase [Candidatus Electryonea clarkiae]|nr:transposase [Candidatus Electryonea clarkiae]MDP8287119.1 transposase [Candidatus Electryonea clarkiae]